MNQYNYLSDDEKSELAERITAGQVTANESECTDEFEYVLHTGRRVVGAYKWGMEIGEFESLEIV